MRKNRRSLRSLTLAFLLAGASMFAQANTATATAVLSEPGAYTFSDAFGVKIADLTLSTSGKFLNFTFDEIVAGYLGDATSLKFYYHNGGKDNVVLLDTKALSSSADHITGKIGGANASFKSAELTYTAAAAVPEPETYAMLVAGLGLMGFVARRRRV